MNWKDIGSAIGSAAPILGGLLGGPAGAAIGTVVAASLGVENTPDDVNAALKNNPDAIVKLQELQTNAKVQLQQLAITSEQNRLQAELAGFQAEVADRQSARQLAAQQPRDFVRPGITALLLLLACSMTFLVFTGYADSVLKDTTASLTVGTLIGFVFNELKQCMSFYFGTTREANIQTRAVTDFAVSDGTVSTPDKDTK